MEKTAGIRRENKEDAERHATLEYDTYYRMYAEVTCLVYAPLQLAIRTLYSTIQ